MTNLLRASRARFHRLGLTALVAVLTIVPRGSALAVPAPVHGPDGAGNPAEAAALPEAQHARRLSAEVFGFLPYWEIDASTDPYLRYDLVTDIAMFSVGLDAAGSVATNAPGYRAITGSYAPAIIGHAHAAGVRVDLTFTSFGFDKNSAFFRSATAMANGVASLTALVNALGLDGVNVDVESLYNQDFAAYGVFVGQLRAALRATNPAARVSVSTNGNVSGTGMANQALANGADRVFVMGYSYRSAGSNPAGSISPITRADGGLSLSTTAALYASKGVPADRILLGLPYYGRTWPTTSPTLHSPTTGSGAVFIPSDDLSAVPAAAAFGYDTLEHSAWFAAPNPTTGAWSQTYYDDERSLRAKYAFAAAQGYAGVGIWTLGYDRGISGYWQAIASSFGAIRLAGSDRYGTATATSANVFQPGVGTVYVATGTAFPDALAAVSPAVRAGGPVLLVTPGGVPGTTGAEIARLHPGRIVVLGSAAAVSDGVLAALQPLATDGAVRIGGSDRYATAAAVSADAFPAGAAVAYLVSGATFADAVSAGPAAARDGGPVLLTDPSSLSGATAAELARLVPGRVVIVGGVGAVAAQVEASVRSVLPAATVERLAGPDRYATSAAVSATFASGAAAVFVAVGTNFPDALAGGAAAGTLGSPVVLTPSTVLAPSVSAELLRLAPRRAVILGGPSVVAESVVVAVRGILAAG